MNEVRLIDANALWKNIAQNSGCPDCLCNKGQMTVLGCIDEAPTVEAEPIRHGYWIPEENGIMRCSNCNETYDDNAFFYFCPKCGFQMGEVGATHKIDRGAEYNALKSKNAELRRLLQSAYDGYTSIVSCKYAPCKECIHDSEPRCNEDWTWKWKHADEVLKLLESNDT